MHPAPDPDKLAALFAMVRHTGIVEPPKEHDAAALRAVLRAAAREGGAASYIGKPPGLARHDAGRVMTNAIRDISDWLQSAICHFTSPIRRYADLDAHRAVKLALAGGEPAVKDERLREAADILNRNERKAQDAEREIQKRLSVLFLRGKIGDVFSGTISGITDFGIFVELSDVMAEGMIRVAELADDYYIFLPERNELAGERTGRRFALGAVCQARLVAANLDQLEITLELAEDRTPKKLRAVLSRRGGVRSFAARAKAAREFGGRAPHRGRKRNGN